MQGSAKTRTAGGCGTRSANIEHTTPQRVPGLVCFTAGCAYHAWFAYSSRPLIANIDPAHLRLENKHHTPHKHETFLFIRLHVRVATNYANRAGESPRPRATVGVSSPTNSAAAVYISRHGAKDDWCVRHTRLTSRRQNCCRPRLRRAYHGVGCTSKTENTRRSLATKATPKNSTTSDGTQHEQPDNSRCCCTLIGTLGGRFHDVEPPARVRQRQAQAYRK